MRRRSSGVAVRSPTAQVDETQANLAFVALHKEPFLTEEFAYLARQIQEIYEVREGSENARRNGPAANAIYHRVAAKTG